MTDLAEHSQIIGWAVDVTTVLTVLGLVFSFVRLIKGPSLPDRVVSIDLITVLAVAIAGLLAITHSEPDFLDIAVVLALVAFLATVAFAWYAERTTALLHRDGQARERTEEPDGR
ncbi:MAG: cation:proton antiporter [Acidobacteria bacterium]|nr:cation:proton antiporter [Acidobacteriota bacterium]